MPEAASSDEHLRALFATFDADGSGTLDAEELLAILTRGAGGLSLEDAKEIVNDFDDNKDGVLSVEEFARFFTVVRSKAQKRQPGKTETVGNPLGVQEASDYL